MSKPHTFVLHKYVQRRICRYCGLLELRNERSRIAAGKPCRWWEGDEQSHR